MKYTKQLFSSALLTFFASSFAEAHPPADIISTLLRDAVGKSTQLAYASFSDVIPSAALRAMAEASQVDLLTLDNVDKALAAADERAELWQNLGLLPTDENLPLSLGTAMATQDAFSSAQFSTPDIYQLRFDIPTIAHVPPVKAYAYNTLVAKDLYPEETAQGLFRTEQDFLNFLFDRHNRLYTYLIAKHNPAVRRNISAHVDDFRHEATRIFSSARPADPVIWAADQVPTDTDTLYIGEGHTSWIPSQLIPLIDRLKTNMNGRELLFLTEFYGKDHAMQFNQELDLLKKDTIFFELWKALAERNIPVIGLEPNFVIGSIETTGTDCKVFPSQSPNGRTVWGTLEGLRIRNQHWIKVYNKVRAEHPNALIIIYAGFGHVSYIAPFSLAREIPGKNFVIEVWPENNLDELDSFFFSLSALPYLSWSQLKLGLVSGFNVRIKLSEPNIKKE